MSRTITKPIALVAAAVATVALAAPTIGRADSTPIGPLPAGPVAKTTTKPGLLVAVALPHAKSGTGLVWRLARKYDTRVVKEQSEADVGSAVVIVFKVVGRGDTRIVYALTRGDTSSKAVAARTQQVHSG